VASKYAISGTMTLVVGDSLIGVKASTTARPRIYYVTVGCSSTPADASMIHQVLGYTGGHGTSTAVTPVPLDASDRAAVATAGQIYTAEPTTPATVASLNIPVHQRSNYQWYAREGGELYAPATANTGFVLTNVACSTGNPVLYGSFHFEE